MKPWALLSLRCCCAGVAHGAWSNELELLSAVRELVTYLPLSNRYGRGPAWGRRCCLCGIDWWPGVRNGPGACELVSVAVSCQADGQTPATQQQVWKGEGGMGEGVAGCVARIDGGGGGSVSQNGPGALALVSVAVSYQGVGHIPACQQQVWTRPMEHFCSIHSGGGWRVEG